MDKIDFKGALIGLDKVVCDITAVAWFEKWANHTDDKENPVAQALLIADRLQSGVTSVECICNGVEALPSVWRDQAEDIFKNGGSASGIVRNHSAVNSVFKAMAEQLIKECKEE